MRFESTISTTFHKQERLCSKTAIDRLFAEGKPLHKYPIKLIHLPATSQLEFEAQAMFVVPKRSFRRANERNVLKRRMKEAYRLHKATLYTWLKTQDKQYHLAFLFTGKQEESFAKIEETIVLLLQKIQS